MYVAIDRSQTTEAASTFIKKIDTWILELRNYAKTCPCLKPRSRKASELLIKHRAANLSYRDALERLGKEPLMENLPPVRAALKELYILKHIE